MGILQMQRSVIAHVNYSRLKASNGSDLKGDLIFLSFFMVLKYRNSLLHVETDERKKGHRRTKAA